MSEITAVKPENIDAESIRKAIKNDFDILLAGGQDHLKGKIFRIGHLGFVNNRDIYFNKELNDKRVTRHDWTFLINQKYQEP